MPLTRLVNTALDGVAAMAEAVRAEIVGFAGSDLVCYRADSPEELAAQQAAHWDPVLDWAHAALGARFMLAAGSCMSASRSRRWRGCARRSGGG